MIKGTTKKADESFEKPKKGFNIFNVSIKI